MFSINHDVISTFNFLDKLFFEGETKELQWIINPSTLSVCRRLLQYITIQLESLASLLKCELQFISNRKFVSCINIYNLGLRVIWLKLLALQSFLLRLSDVESTCYLNTWGRFKLAELFFWLRLLIVSLSDWLHAGISSVKLFCITPIQSIIGWE